MDKLCTTMSESEEESVSQYCGVLQPKHAKTVRFNNDTPHVSAPSADLSPPETCVLCKAAGRQDYNTHWLLECSSLTEEDRYDILYGHNSEVGEEDGHVHEESVYRYVSDEEESDIHDCNVMSLSNSKAAKLASGGTPHFSASVTDLQPPETCSLCEIAGRQGCDTHWLLDCPFLSEGDRYDFLYGHDSDADEEDVNWYDSCVKEEDDYDHNPEVDEDNVYGHQFDDKENRYSYQSDDENEYGHLSDDEKDVYVRKNTSIHDKWVEPSMHAAIPASVTSGQSPQRNVSKPTQDESIGCISSDHEIIDGPMSVDHVDSTCMSATSSITRPTLVAYYDDMPIPIIVSSGSHVNMIGLNIVQSFEMPYEPIHRVSDHDVIPDGAVGEVHCQLFIDQTALQLDAFVMPQDKHEILGGVPFMTVNDVFVLPSKKLIIISDSLTVEYGRNSISTTESLNNVSSVNAYSEMSEVSCSPTCMLYHDAVEETLISAFTLESATPISEELHLSPKCAGVVLIHPVADLVSEQVMLKVSYVLQQSAVVCQDGLYETHICEELCSCTHLKSVGVEHVVTVPLTTKIIWTSRILDLRPVPRRDFLNLYVN